MADVMVWVWGTNSGEYPDDYKVLNWSTPMQVPGLTDVRAVAAGGEHSLAVRSNGTVWAWGDNSDGQLGDGTTTNQPAPVQVPGLTDVRAVAAGMKHSLAVRGDGTVWSWGPAHGPQSDLDLTDARAVATGSYSLVLCGDGTVWSWNPMLEQQPDLTDVIAIAAGREHFLALTV